MRLLAIESAFEACSVALADGSGVLERVETGPRQHAEQLLPMVEALCAEAGLALTALDGIAFSRGPGSFTSLRIGIGVVQGLAWGADLPVVPVSSLRTVAQAAAETGVTRAWVAMDARMDEVFSGRFALEQGIMQAHGGEQVGPAQRCVPAVLDGWVGVGNGFARFEALSGLALEKAPEVIARAAVLLKLATPLFAAGQGIDAADAQPVYLRNKVAEKAR